MAVARLRTVFCYLFLMAACATAKADSHEVSGIDVSRYQGAVDFEAVKAAGIDFVAVRATDGITYQDPDFARNFGDARAAGLVVGAYHFYESEDDPADQLQNFTFVVKLEPGDLPPIIDIERLHEKDDAGLDRNLRRFIKGLEVHYGVRPIIYTGLRFSNRHLTGFGDYALWLAEYEESEPVLPEGWTDWTFWQWSQAWDAAGVNGKVDADRFNGDRTRFDTLLVKKRGQAKD